ncbi:MAG TPA: hypothetical protein VEQ67_08240, partial [Mycobacterium sp.]|nr:hypothetical protein [Mycobacterium sp.]
MALGRVYRLGRRRPVKPYEAGGLHVDAERPELSIEECGCHGAAADVAVTHDQQSARPRSSAQRSECLPPPEWMEDPVWRPTYAQQQINHHPSLLREGVRVVTTLVVAT